jgi:subtilisin family serine protease
MMRKKNILILITLLITCYLNAQPTRFYLQITDPTYVPRIVGKDKATGKLSFESGNTELRKILDKYNITHFEQAFPTETSEFLLRSYLVICNDQGLGEELKVAFPLQMPLVEYLCEPQLLFEPDDYGLALTQLNLDLIRADQAYDLHMDITKSPIAIIDTYFDLNHEDLQFSGMRGTNDPNKAFASHGTWVCGAAAAISNNSMGLASASYRNPIYASSIQSDSEVLVMAQAGYRIINCSWYNSCTSSIQQDSLYWRIRNIWNAVAVFGAGNKKEHCGSLSAKVYPASYTSCVSVTSVGHGSGNADCHEEIPGIDSTAHHHNDAVDICAPGYCVSTTDITDTNPLDTAGAYYGSYGPVWGTSIASPEVASVVSIIFAINPCLTANEAVNILLGSTDNSIYSKPENQPYIGLIGTGRLDVYQATLDAIESATLHVDGSNLTGTQSYSGIYLSSANSTVKNGAHITFQAGRDITLNAGFSVELGAEFTTASIPVSCN